MLKVTSFHIDEFEKYNRQYGFAVVIPPPSANVSLLIADQKISHQILLLKMILLKADLEGKPLLIE